MYLSHFGLNQSPFGITPNPAFFFTGNKRGAILEALIYAVTHGEGIIKVTGEVGSGKTMLCRMLESNLPSNIEVIYLVNPTLGKDEVVYAIASELGLATGGKRPDEVIRLLQNDLITKHVAGKQIVLLIEEAQAMPLDTLEEIRLFSNLETAHHKLLQIVLFGQPELDENLRLPRMRQLKERITHSFQVPPMEADVIPEFLMFRMRAAGYHGPNIFSKAALKQMARVSEGIVRRISILADKSLLAAFADNTHSIEAKHVKAAILDSEFSHTAATRLRKWQLALFLGAGMLAASALAWQFFKPGMQAMALATPTAPAAAVIPETTASQAVALTKPAPAITPVTTIKNFAPASKTSSASAASLSPSSTVTSAAPASSLLQQRLDTTHAWLAHENPDLYTIQISLMEAGNKLHIERFLLKAEKDLGNVRLHAFPTQLGGVPRIGITFGSYTARLEALAAIATLTKQWGYQPQLRTINRIQKEIERTKSERLWRQ